MVEHNSVHEDMNDYVNEIEQKKLHDLDELIHFHTLAPHMQRKMEEALKKREENLRGKKK